MEKIGFLRKAKQIIVAVQRLGCAAGQEAVVERIDEVERRVTGKKLKLCRHVHSA